MGLTAGTAAARDPRRHGVSRLVHQRPDRGPAGRRGHPARPAHRPDAADAGGARLDAGQGAGRGGGPGRGFHRGRRGVAQRRLLDVPGHEPRSARARASAARRPRTGTSRAGRARAAAPTWCRRWSPRPPRCAEPCPPRPISSRSGRRPLTPARPPTAVRRPALADPTSQETTMDAFTHAHRRRDPAAPHQRRHRPDHPGGVPQADHPDRFRGRPVRRLAQRPDLRAEPARRSRRGSVLVAGADFGTGSSREHAVWALMDYGIRVVISPRFADIFRGNAGKGGLLAAQVTQDDVELLWKLLENEPGTEVTVDLRAADDLGRAAGDRLPDRSLHPLAAARGLGRHLVDPAARRRNQRISRPVARPSADHRLSRPAAAGRVGLAFETAAVATTVLDRRAGAVRGARDAVRGAGSGRTAVRTVRSTLTPGRGGLALRRFCAYRVRPIGPHLPWAGESWEGQ